MPLSMLNLLISREGYINLFEEFYLHMTLPLSDCFPSCSRMCRIRLFRPRMAYLASFTSWNGLADSLMHLTHYS